MREGEENVATHQEQLDISGTGFFGITRFHREVHSWLRRRFGRIATGWKRVLLSTLPPEPPPIRWNPNPQGFEM